MNLNSVEVLLVEDNITDAELTIRELKKHNMANNLVHVKDGEEALGFYLCYGQICRAARDIEHPPKVILLDIQMPKVNGIEVLQKIKSDDRRTKAIPVVVLNLVERKPRRSKMLCILVQIAIS